MGIGGGGVLPGHLHELGGDRRIGDEAEPRSYNMTGAAGTTRTASPASPRHAESCWSGHGMPSVWQEW